MAVASKVARHRSSAEVRVRGGRRSTGLVSPALFPWQETDDRQADNKHGGDSFQGNLLLVCVRAGAAIPVQAERGAPTSSVGGPADSSVHLLVPRPPCQFLTVPKPGGSETGPGPGEDLVDGS